MATNSDVTKVDGSLDFSGGVNSVKVTTIQSQQNPNGLARNELAWLDNATCRDGGITQRFGWLLNGQMHDGSALFQGWFMYEPVGADPYLIASIGGQIYRVDPDTGAATNLTALFPGTDNPPAEAFAFFCQAEQFLVIQAGDSVTLPLIWDGSILRRSIGITNTAVAPGTPGVNEIPAATCMDYYMGRLWYAQGRQYSAGDIVGGGSGTLAYGFRDAVLNVTENPLVLGGDGFVVPTQDGIIRALKHGAAIDAALGQGRLFIFTRKAVYALQVPVTRADWIAATNNNQPLQTVVQLVNGSVNDRSVVSVNGDLFYQSLEPGIRSLMQSVRYFTQWGNIQISANEQRILQFNDRSLLRAASGIFFDNYLFQTALPKLTPQGIAHQALVPMDFIPISSFGQQKQPVWLGMDEGVDFLQLATGDFGGRDRAFAAVVSRGDAAAPAGTIQLWEITSFSKEDKIVGENGNRVSWIIETPAFTWGREFDLKKLVACELWVDRLFGTVQFILQYRPDGAACWVRWHEWKECSPKNSNETVQEPIAYPLLPCLESYRSTMMSPKPPEGCASATGRPTYIGYQFQVRLIVKGFCRIRGILLHAEMVERALYKDITC